jgi:hypothetical protein
MPERSLPVSEFCAKFNQWAELLAEKDEYFAEAWQTVFCAIDHSNLLWRLLYAGENLRSTPCPVHKGRWSGCGPDQGCGCWSYGNITGWLAEQPGNPTVVPPVLLVQVAPK